MSNVSDPFSILNTGQVKRAEPVPKAKRYWVKKIEKGSVSSSSESDSEEEENLTEEQKKIKQMEKEKKKQEKIKRKQEIIAKKQKAKKQNDDIFSDLEEEDEDEEDNVFKQITKNQNLNQNNNESQNQEQNNGQPKRRVIQAAIIQQNEEKQTEIVERPARRRVIQSTQIISTDQNNDGDKKENEVNQNKEVEVKIKQTEEIDVSSRRQRLARRRMEEEEEEEEELDEIQEIQRKKQIQNQNQNKNQSNEEKQKEQKEEDDNNNKVQIIGKSLTVPSKESQVIRNRKEKIEQEEEEEESDQGEESDESDYADDYADEDETRNIQKMLKPVFLTAAERQKRDLKEEEERRLKEEKWKNQERILQETKNLVVKELAKGENEDELNEEGEQMPDDDDDIDKEKEAEQWKIRELKRIKRDRDERLKYQKLQQEVERRRNLTEEQRIQEDLEKEKKNPKKEKTKYVFMQKYYHKGAFYQGDEEDDPNSILNRDFNVAVGEELFDKSQLRNFQQKRRGMYGVKGQSKYTHLTDQDTTNYDPSFKVDENIQQKMFQKYAGFKNANVLERKQLKRKI
ncbi:hypothetical protein PPERSA_05532 [Pseudocohnilembus persalinus]|uniref:Micro-fibrillar-associated protein 1 C-terminal domain-containing protein n=1 Tax=Pseudocohnilembus persalinus TaxID=266149 RepID=A0A0V0QSX9_PSEPJ|nr:hypothetical protein PPERSA_05532 [Pseudocohnilembus persalinus]|eukprot:KRX05423.1 hypothetical protein PPERSA_05532 [Pseudocohnilembus persalinus]